jgi:hypothetical protein
MVEASLSSRLDAYLAWADERIERDGNQKPEFSSISAWAGYPLLETMNEMYAITGDVQWLHKLADYYGYFRSWRGNVRGTLNYQDIAAPQWYEGVKLDIFHVSPLHYYNPADTEEIMRQRGWSSLWFSNINYDGLMMVAPVRFAVAVRQAGLTEFNTVADQIIADAKATFASHEPEWSGEFYIFPRNSPFFLDGVEVPINEAASFGSALVLMYQATGDSQYLTRAQQMMARWLPAVEYSPLGMTYPYVTGIWRQGWGHEASPSINSPEAAPNLNVETFHKAGFTIEFARLLNAQSPSPELQRFITSFTNVLADADDELMHQVSLFPMNLDRSPPPVGDYVENPAGFRGWERVAANDPKAWDRMYLMAATSTDPQASGTMVSLLANTPHGTPEPKITSEQIVLSPRAIGDRSPACLYTADHDAVVSLRFAAPHFMHKQLIIYTDPTSDYSHINLVSDGAGYSATAYFKEGDCIDWRWGAEGKMWPILSQPLFGIGGEITATEVYLEDASNASSLASKPAATNAQSSS